MTHTIKINYIDHAQVFQICSIAYDERKTGKFMRARENRMRYHLIDIKNYLLLETLPLHTIPIDVYSWYSYNFPFSL